MPKALKISGFEITEVEVLNGSGFIQDPDYQERTRLFDSHELTRPATWAYEKFKLAFVCWGQFKEEDEKHMNILGTYIYRMLKHENAILRDIIPGPVYLINEDKDGIIDLTKENLRYIIQQSRHFENLAHDDVEDHLFMLKVFGAIMIKFPELM